MITLGIIVKPGSVLAVMPPRIRQETNCYEIAVR